MLLCGSAQPFLTRRAGEPMRTPRVSQACASAKVVYIISVALDVTLFTHFGVAAPLIDLSAMQPDRQAVDKAGAFSKKEPISNESDGEITPLSHTTLSHACSSVGGTLRVGERRVLIGFRVSRVSLPELSSVSADLIPQLCMIDVDPAGISIMQPRPYI